MANTTVTVNVEGVEAVQQRLEELRILALDFEAWALDVAPHSYLEGRKAALLRERVKVLTGLPKED